MVAPGTFTPAAAISYCDGLTLGGYGDWRLPSTILVRARLREVLETLRQELPWMLEPRE